MASTLKLVNVVRELVSPATPTPPQIMVLNDVDQRVIEFGHVPYLCFFQARQGLKLLPGTDLKASLAKALTLYFPLAGRFKRRQGRPALELDVDCNDAGALFVEAEAAEGTLEELGGYQLKAEVTDVLLPSLEEEVDVEQVPLLIVQLTRFRCGGAILIIGLHHAVGDGLSAARFAVAWSALALGKEVAVVPLHDRSLLHPRVPPRVECEHPDYSLLPPDYSNQGTAYVDASGTGVLRLDLEVSHLAIVKERAREGAPDPQAASFTTFEALMGQIWRCVVRARGLDRSTTVALEMAVDGRTRLEPPLPPGFFGNASFSATALTTVGELLEGPPNRAVQIVHKAVAGMDDRYLRSSLDFLALQDSPRSVFRSRFPLTPTDSGVSSWKEFPFYDVDFGMGRPDLVKPARGPGVDGLMFLLPGHRIQGGINAFLGLAHDVIAKLHGDPEFQYLLQPQMLS